MMEERLFPNSEEKFTRRVRPTPTDEYLNNPHKGCCTANSLTGDPLHLPHRIILTADDEIGRKQSALTIFPKFFQPVTKGYLPSTVAYHYFYWNKLSPGEGEYDFSLIDRILEKCKERGQTLSVRIPPHGPTSGPSIPKWYEEKYPVERSESQLNKGNVIPVYNAQEYLEHFGGLMRAFARKYDTNPLIESIDMAYIGPWGEGAGEYSEEQASRFAQLFKESFVHIPRMAEIGGKQLAPAIASGSGWRCDCFGDLQPSGYGGKWWFDCMESPNDPRAFQVPCNLSRNHMYDFYPKQIIQSGATDAWKKGPIHYETCWTPMYWYQNGFDIDFIIEQGLKYHATCFQAKSTVLPDQWIDKLDLFCRKLGYRFVFRQAVFEPPAKRGQPFHFEAWIENVGVAPMYRKYNFALRFRQGKHQSIVVFDDTDTRKWLPGDIWIEKDVDVPPELRPGMVELSAGLVEPQTKECRINFAVKERYRDRWVALGDIFIY